MGEIVNLNRARKAQARNRAQKTAETNRVAFGLTKLEKTEAKRARERDALRLDGHRLTED